MRVPSGQELKNRPDSDAGPSDAWMAVANVRIHGNSFAHDGNIADRSMACNRPGSDPELLIFGDGGLESWANLVKLS